MRLRPLLPVLPLFALLASPSLAWAQDKEEEATPEEEFIYQWTDDEGVIHFVDELSKIPPKHREGPGLRKIPVGTAEPDPPAQTNASRGGWSGGSSSSAPVEREEPTPAPQDPAARLQELRKQRDDLLIRINQLEEGSATPDLEDRDEEELERLLDQTEKMLTQVDREIRELEEEQR